MQGRNSKKDHPLLDAASPTEDEDVDVLVHRQRKRDKFNREEARRQRRAERIALMQNLTELAKKSDIWQPTKRWKFANPGPISLIGYGMTIILMCLVTTGHWQYYAVALGMSVVFGGGIQLVGGILEYVCGNTLPWTIFTLNGAYWLSVVGLFMFQTRESGGSPILQQPTEYFVGVYFLLWSIVSASFVFCSFRVNVIAFAILFTQFLAYLMITIGGMAHHVPCYHAAGYIGVVSGGLAMYLAYAEIFNEVFDRVMLPVPSFQQIPYLRDMALFKPEGISEEAGADKKSLKVAPTSRKASSSRASKTADLSGDEKLE